MDTPVSTKRPLSAFNNADAKAPFDPTLCETWWLVAPGEPCPTCSDGHDERVSVKRAELAFRAERSTFEPLR